MSRAAYLVYVKYIGFDEGYAVCKQGAEDVGDSASSLMDQCGRRTQGLKALTLSSLGAIPDTDSQGFC